MLFKMWKM